MRDLKGFIEEQLEIWEVPGCAVAIVRDGEVALAEGFGRRDVASELPVTASTLFPIGSTTKAFTAATVGILVDEGLLEWENSVRDYIPSFRMHDPVATERLTPRDLLSHSSGLPRHEFVWLGHPGRSRGDLVSRLRHLPPSADLRLRWQYCNLGYLIAGYLVETVSGIVWERFVESRLLEPLGMKGTNLSIEQVEGSDDHSKPYERRGEEVIEIPFRAIENVGPAGSINSSASDMSRWLRMNLGTSSEAEQSVSIESLRYIHAPQALIPRSSEFPELSDIAYGLGWVIGSYRGRRHVHHNGGVDGFYTECMLLPDEKVGVFVVSNRLTLLSRVVALRALDEALELESIDWSSRLKERIDAAIEGGKEAKASHRRVAGAGLLRDLAEYEGEYEHPGYGRIKIEVHEDRLKPSFGELSLELTHRHFDVFELELKELSEETSWPLTFTTAPDGEVEGLTIPFEPTLEAIRFVRQADELSRDPEVLHRLAGPYEMGPIKSVVELKDSTVTLTVAGQSPVELVPQRGLRFGVKGSPSTSVEFFLQGADVEKLVIEPGGVFRPSPGD